LAAFAEGFSRGTNANAKKVRREALRADHERFTAQVRQNRAARKSAARQLADRRKFWLTYKEFLTVIVCIPLGFAALYWAIGNIFLVDDISHFMARGVNTSTVISVIYIFSFITRRDRAIRAIQAEQSAVKGANPQSEEQ